MDNHPLQEKQVTVVNRLAVLDARILRETLPSADPLEIERAFDIRLCRGRELNEVRNEILAIDSRGSAEARAITFERKAELRRIELLLETRIDASAESASADPIILGWVEELFSIFQEQPDHQLVRLYLKLKGKLKGAVFAGVTTAGVCAGCFRSLHSRLFSQVQEAKWLLQCPSCRRLLLQEAQMKVSAGSTQ